MRGQDKCRRCAGPNSARKKARERVAEEDARNTLRGLGKPVPHNLTEGVLDEIYWLKGSILFIKDQIEEIDQEAIVWGVTEHSDKTGGEDWGVKTTEKAAVNVWVRLLQEQQKLYLEFVHKAHGMGIEERRIRLAEQYGMHLLGMLRMLADRIRVSLESLGWDGDELAEVWDEMLREQIPETLKSMKELGS